MWMPAPTTSPRDCGSSASTTIPTTCISTATSRPRITCGAALEQPHVILGREVAVEMQVVGIVVLAEDPQSLGDVVGAGIHIGPEPGRLHADARDRLQRL